MDKARIKSKIMKQYSIGIDIEKISRFRGKKIKSPFLKRIYTPDELRHCFNKGLPAEHLAGRFAAKESIKKALALFVKQPINYRDIEIINDKFGMPKVFLRKGRGNKFYISLSISHAGDIASAAAIAAQK